MSSYNTALRTQISETILPQRPIGFTFNWLFSSFAMKTNALLCQAIVSLDEDFLRSFCKAFCCELGVVFLDFTNPIGKSVEVGHMDY